MRLARCITYNAICTFLCVVLVARDDVCLMFIENCCEVDALLALCSF